MATSGSYSFDPTFVHIVTSAYRKLGVLNENETPTAGMFSDANYAINSLVKEWEATGIHVWTEEEGILFVQPNQIRYRLGTGTTDHATDAFTYTLQTLSANAALSTKTLTVTDITDISINQTIGIVLDDGTTQWTTVNHIPSGSTVRIADALTDTAASGNNIFVYTSGIVRPLKMPDCRLMFFGATASSIRETPMNEFSRAEYMDLPTKTNSGTPTAFFYTPKIPYGELFIWPAPQNSSYALRFTWYRPIQDFLSNDNTSDLPQEWINCLTWNLAVELAPDFSVPPQRFAILKSMADEKLDLVRGYDREAQPIYFQLGDPETGRA